MIAACLAVGGLLSLIVIGIGIDKLFETMTAEELEKKQQVYQSILDDIDPQRIEEKRQEKLMNDYEYYLLTGELPPTE